MGIRKRGDKWLVTAESGRDEFGVRRRVCRTVDTEDEAKRLDAKLQNDVYEGRHVKPSSESVAAFCQRFLDGRDKIAPATRSRYQAYLKHVKPRPRARSRSRASRPGSPPAGRRSSSRAATCRPARCASTSSSSSAAMNLAVARHLIAENPMDHVELPDDEPPPFHVYTPSEQAALLSAAAPGDGDADGRSQGAE